MKVQNLFGAALLASSCLALTALNTAQAQDALNLNELLELVREGQARDNSEHNDRVRTFQQQQAQQTRLLQEAQQEKARQEALSEQRETTFDENDLLIADVQQQLEERLGSLRELLGVLQQVAGDARSTSKNT
jgi:biopolymer transport protein ExbB